VSADDRGHDVAPGEMSYCSLEYMGLSVAA
jgi:hypothetical protein